MDLPIENVQSYPRPPIVEPVPQRILIVLGSVEIVDTTRALRVLETHHPADLLHSPGGCESSFAPPPAIHPM